MTELRAADGLRFILSEDAEASGLRGRIAWGDPDWFGPVSLAVQGKPEPLELGASFEGQDALGAFHGLELGCGRPLRASVRAYPGRPLLVFRLEALRDCDGLATGSFDRPVAAWPQLSPKSRDPAGLPEEARAFGHQYTEFALPTFSDPSCANFFLLPQRPSVVQPLFMVHPDGRALGLLPLDRFHEQIIAVCDGVSCGWQGDLAQIPRGFASELAVWGGAGVRPVYERWGTYMREHHGTARPSRYADASVGRLSYWTDNGAAYWYRSEPGETVPETLESTLRELRDTSVPVHAVELDSWFYPHETPRPLNYDEDVIVPPTGMLRWEAREDILPEGVSGLAERLGRPPLILHSRHFSSQSPYFEEHEAWNDGAQAHPTQAELFDRLMAQAHDWGAIAYEQDWLVQSYVGVRGLREAPGRARAWHAALDAAAGRHGLSLIYCMATPADFLETLRLPRVTCIRTSGDYRYMIGNASLWTWFLLNNALARALGLPAFKDVFLSSSEGTGLDGDPHAEVEALLSALSAGPVGIGDRRGRSDRTLVLRTCRPDGVLVKPDVPIAALDSCFHHHPHTHPVPLVAETYSDHAAGRWVYLIALHAWREREPLRYEVSTDQLPYALEDGEWIAYDWRGGTFQRLSAPARLAGELAPQDWAFHVLCPLLAGEIAIAGDVSRYACAGDRRLRRVHETGSGVELEVLGAPGESLTLTGWCPREPRVEGAQLRYAPKTGRFDLDLDLPDRGWQPVRIR